MPPLLQLVLWLLPLLLLLLLLLLQILSLSVQLAYFSDGYLTLGQVSQRSPNTEASNTAYCTTMYTHDDYVLQAGYPYRHHSINDVEALLIRQYSYLQQEAQLILPNLYDVFRGQSRSPNMVQFDMLGMVSY